MMIETSNLLLISCDPEILRSAIEGNSALARKLDVTVQDDWTGFGVAALQYSLDKVTDSEEERNWWTYFPVHKQDNTLIGSGGYKGRPTTDGTVELGYEIAPNYRNRGLATEMTAGLIEHAFKDDRVKAIIAHTLAQDNASTKVLHKCGFQKVGEINDPDDGLIWRWERKRQ
ncbi:N-acetyltransferase [Segetibacter sp. 3557_3]|uniref:GNAT family N-acetyltransferase n=1 Tax=Segetibacter sp. 3557_3 TaxID=2547429 RepID=UPI00105889F5|nr:GNAT family N-acetyltransferase [Segetibacter sp. 3557_3]TDH26940.1 N-acetyltransferase [Segetibacter sp. 3557_3]